MSKRHRGHIPVSEMRNSLGAPHLDAAIHKINGLQQRAVTCMVHYPVSIDDTIRMFVSDEDYAVAKAAKGVVHTPYSMHVYEIADQCALSVDYDDAALHPILSERFCPHLDRLQPLLKVIEEIRQIYWNFEEVKACLRWLNITATPGAIRYYWPPILKLAGESPAFKDLQEVPTRYSQPFHIGARLQMLRDTATTMAGAELLPPDIKARPRNQMYLTFKSVIVQRDNDPSGEAKFKTDSILFNL